MIGIAYSARSAGFTASGPFSINCNSVAAGTLHRL